MSRREEFESIVEAFAEYEGAHAYALRFLIALACDLQIALDQITLADCRGSICAEWASCSCPAGSPAAGSRRAPVPCYHVAAAVLFGRAGASAPPAPSVGRAAVLAPTRPPNCSTHAHYCARCNSWHPDGQAHAPEPADDGDRYDCPNSPMCAPGLCAPSCPYARELREIAAAHVSPPRPDNTRHTHCCPRCHDHYRCGAPGCAEIDDVICNGCDADESARLDWQLCAA